MFNVLAFLFLGENWDVFKVLSFGVTFVVGVLKVFAFVLAMCLL